MAGGSPLRDAAAPGFETEHRVRFEDARTALAAEEGDVHLVVTSPPYPMVAMWDDLFRSLDPRVGAALDDERGEAAFDAMHETLRPVWAALHERLVPGGILALNVGDATRSLGGRFRLWSNHARLLHDLAALGFDVLPDILWRKPNNSPTKFMGSGMLPAGAYVTYEHEYVLVLRKGGPRVFAREEERRRRRRSAFFWEERNRWFTDLWEDMRGREQGLGPEADRRRSAAFPFALAARLIHMFSVTGDRVLDPFLGTGTTSAAAIATGRSSLGYECDPSLRSAIEASLRAAPELGRRLARERLEAHRAFVTERAATGRPCAHHNATHGVAVVTRQERELALTVPDAEIELEPGSERAAGSPPDGAARSLVARARHVGL